MKSVRVPVQVPTESLTFPLRQAADRFPDKVAVVEPEVGGARMDVRGTGRPILCVGCFPGGPASKPGRPSRTLDEK